MASPKTQEILEKTGKDRARLLEFVEDLTDEQMSYRPEELSWSIGEVLHHLVLAHEATAKLMSLMLQRAKEEGIGPDPEPSRSVLGSIDQIVAGADDTKVSAPDRVTPRSHLAPADALTRLDASRKRLEDTVDELSRFDLEQLRFSHPFFGELDACQWLLVTGWHERRHTRQIERIRTSPGFSA